MSEHAFLPPSGAGAWVHCGAWPHMNQRFPREPTDDTREGEAAHDCAALMLAGVPIGEGETIAATGYVVTADLLEGADLYVDEIDKRLARYNLNRSALVVERRVEIPRVNPANWGTPDTWFYAPEASTLEVLDFKFGFKTVEAFENWQLVDYAAGILSELVLTRNIREHETRVVLTVVQPRSYHAGGSVRTWETSAVELRPYVQRLNAAALAALAPTQIAQVGDHCEHCSGRAACPTLQASAYNAADLAGASAVVELTPHAAALELRLLERASRRLEARVTGLRETVEAKLRRGEPVPFYRLAQTPGRQTWAKPPAEVLALGRVLGVDVAKPGLLTPLQAITAGLPESVVTAFSTRPRATKLVAETAADAAKVFR